MTAPSDPRGFSGEGAGASVVRPGEGREFQIGQLRLTVKEAGERTDGQLVVLEMEVPPGAASPPAHIHRQGGESWYVLKGELEVRAGDHQGHYGPGSFVMIPAGTPHRFANGGSGPVQVLLTMTPYQLQFLEAVSRLSAGGPPGRDQLVELMARYDTVLVQS
jgi:quercetin dioxygenase-like cupin family protein